MTTVHDEHEWDAIAKKIAPLLKSGTILTLSGPLGAGKTTFVQSLARLLGATVRPKSPTFALVRTYKLPPTSYKLSRLVHVDAYRLEKPEDLLPLDLDEELEEEGTIVAIEWPENVEAWVKRHAGRVVAMKITQEEDGTRRVDF